MSQVAFKGQPVKIGGVFPKEGQTAPTLLLTGADLADVRLSQFAGKKKILSIVPSLDTPVCAISARKFNAEVAGLEQVVMLKISMDLPFAQKRFCDSERINNIVMLSAFRYPAFGLDYGVRIVDGPLTGLLARAVLVLDEQDQVIHAQLVPDIAQEPDYAAALQAVRR